jgi:hypothetical protein
LRRHLSKKYHEAEKGYLEALEESSRCSQDIEQIEAYLTGPELIAEREAIRKQGETVFLQGFEAGLRELIEDCNKRTPYELLHQRALERLKYGSIVSPQRQALN